MPVKTRLIQIGNSQGVRIPKAMLDQSGLSGDIQMEVKANSIVILPATHPRTGWDAAFATLAENGDDALLDPGIAPSEWDTDEWQWD